MTYPNAHRRVGLKSSIHLREMSRFSLFDFYLIKRLEHINRCLDPNPYRSWHTCIFLQQELE